MEDAFNYYLSKARIWVECAFGEIDMRWGIFWKKLSFNLDNTVNIIDAALRLHNFIVDYRNEEKKKNNKDSSEDKEDFNEFEKELSEFSKLYPESIVGVFGDGVNDETFQGRNTRAIEELRSLGMDMRDNMRNQLARHNKKRVNTRGYKKNQNNHVRMTNY